MFIVKTTMSCSQLLSEATSIFSGLRQLQLLVAATAIVPVVVEGFDPSASCVYGGGSCTSSNADTSTIMGLTPRFGGEQHSTN